MANFFTCIAKDKKIYYISKEDRLSGKLFSADSDEHLREHFKGEGLTEENSALLAYNPFRDIITVIGDESTYDESVYKKIEKVVKKDEILHVFNLKEKLNSFQNAKVKDAPEAQDIPFILKGYKHFVYPQLGNTTSLYAIEEQQQYWKMRDADDKGSQIVDGVALEDLWKVYLVSSGKQYRTLIKSIFYRNQFIKEATSETLEAAINCYSKKFFPIKLTKEEKEFIRLWDDCNVIALEKPFQLYWDEDLSKVKVKEL